MQLMAEVSEIESEHSNVRSDLRVASAVAALLRSQRRTKVRQLAKDVELSESRLQHLFGLSLILVCVAAVVECTMTPIVSRWTI